MNINLNGKKALIFGIANDKSIAWEIARVLYKNGVKNVCAISGTSLTNDHLLKLKLLIYFLNLTSCISFG
mgnify:CR=1 FL=1